MDFWSFHHYFSHLFLPSLLFIFVPLRSRIYICVAGLQVKRTYTDLPDFMTAVAKKELADLAASVTTCNVVYLPQLGFFLRIPTAQTGGLAANPALDFVVSWGILAVLTRKVASTNFRHVV